MKEFIIRISVKVKGLITKLFRLIFIPLFLLSRKIVLPGFRGVSLYEVGLFFIRGMKKSSISLRANAISYSFIIAFVPAVLFLFTLIPYIPITDLKENMMMTLQEVIPYEAFILLRSTIEDIITNQQTGLLSISFLITLYFAGSGVIAIMNAFNQSSHSIESRTSLKKQLIALLLVFILAVNMIISGAALALSSIVLYFMESKGIISDNSTLFLLQAGQWVIILLTSLIAFSSIYYLAPAKKRVFPFFSAGSILASLLSVLSFKVFSIFIENFTNYNRFYGSLGTMIMIIVWINLTALMLLIGFELNASIYEASKNKLNDKEGSEGDA
ncbi:MAG: YihY/virulence factor BrkB family protein [Bacteroidales bacterium]|nr:YihY/virulence factor BrkB family protein [Bacteroidales bacterium]